jgi:hypothetical protein
MQSELEIDRVDAACGDALSFRDIESRQIAGSRGEAVIADNGESIRHIMSHHVLQLCVSYDGGLRY